MLLSAKPHCLAATDVFRVQPSGYRTFATQNQP